MTVTDAVSWCHYFFPAGNAMLTGGYENKAFQAKAKQMEHTSETQGRPGEARSHPGLEDLSLSVTDAVSWCHHFLFTISYLLVYRFLSWIIST